MSSKSMVYWCTTEEVAHISDPARPLHHVLAPFLVSSPTNQVSFCYGSCTKPQQLSRPLSQSQAKAFSPLVLYQISAPLPSFCLSTTPHLQVFITRVKNRFQILQTISNKKVSIFGHMLLHKMNIICTKT